MIPFHLTEDEVFARHLNQLSWFDELLFLFRFLLEFQGLQESQVAVFSIQMGLEELLEGVGWLELTQDLVRQRPMKI